jgi:outer membrane protein
MITGLNNSYIRRIVLCVCLFFPINSQAEESTLSLNQALQEALLSNLNLKLEKEKLAESIGVTRAAEGIFDTTIRAGANTGQRQRTPLLTGGIEDETTANWSAGLSKTFTPGTKIDFSWDNSHIDNSPVTYLLNPIYSSGLNLTLTQPLLQGFGENNQTARIRAAEKQQAASGLIVESRAADLAAEVKNSYWNLVFSYQDIDVQKLSLELAQKLLEETAEKIDAGKLANVEIFRPQSEVARREQLLITAERAIGLADDRMKILLNNEEWEVSIIPTDLPNVEIKALDIQAILENAFTNRPDLKAAKLYTEAADIALLSAKDRTRSSLSLLGSVGLGGTDNSYGDSLDYLASDSDTSWLIGLAFSRPLDNSFAKGEKIQAEAVRNQARTSSQILKQEVRRSVRSALRDVNLAIKAMEAAKKTSLSTLKGLEAEQIKFNAGRGTTLDVLVAQESYSTALSQENLAKINYAKTLAELDRIQGIVTMASN